MKDHLGNNRVVINSAGTVQQMTHYYPFGGEFASTSGTLQPYKYNGKEQESETGMYDYGARYMNPVQGRFTTMDPLAEKYYSMTPYGYCAGNPMRFVDPTGEDFWDFLQGVAQSIRSNMTWGLTPKAPEQVRDAGHYNAGRNVGDVASMLMGAVEMIQGAMSAIGNGSATVTTGGASATITGVATVQGALTATHGTGVTVTAIKNLSKQEGRISEANGKSSGKNEKHGDGGRAKSKTEKQIEDLEMQKQGAARAEKQKIEKKIQNIKKDAERKNKGEEHSRGNKR